MQITLKLKMASGPWLSFWRLLLSIYSLIKLNILKHAYHMIVAKDKRKNYFGVTSWVEKMSKLFGLVEKKMLAPDYRFQLADQVVRRPSQYGSIRDFQSPQSRIIRASLWVRTIWRWVRTIKLISKEPTGGHQHQQHCAPCRAIHNFIFNCNLQLAIYIHFISSSFILYLWICGLQPRI